MFSGIYLKGLVEDVFEVLKTFIDHLLVLKVLFINVLFQETEVVKDFRVVLAGLLSFIGLFLVV